MIRIGIGQDQHQLILGRPLIIGGVQIEHPTGLAGHSDADVLTHAVIDALLGSLALGTIGEHFPDSDERWAGVCSLELLAATRELIERAGLEVANVDSVITAQAPRLQPHLAAMSNRLAGQLALAPTQVSVKA
ncbi:MAG: 2-C-methyl-D-erythritol 2,4-cyclodiphosphate synthase, partial [Candidatus Dormibacteraceae bacterium]